MDTQQAEAAASAMASCSEEDGAAIRCPLWRQVREEARSMVSVFRLFHVYSSKLAACCLACVCHFFMRCSEIPRGHAERFDCIYQRVQSI